MASKSELDALHDQPVGGPADRAGCILRPGFRRPYSDLNRLLVKRYLSKLFFFPNEFDEANSLSLQGVIRAGGGPGHHWCRWSEDSGKGDATAKRASDVSRAENGEKHINQSH